MNTGFNLKPAAAFAPSKRVSLSFEVLKPGIDFSPAMKGQDGIFLQHKAVLSTENLSLSVTTSIDDLSQVFWSTCCSVYTSPCCFTLHFSVTGTASLLASNSAASSPPHFHRIKESWGLTLDPALTQGNVVAGLIFYPDHANFLRISNKAGFTFLSFTCSLQLTLSTSFKSFSFAFTTWQTVWSKGSSFQPLSAFDMASSLNVIVSTF